MKKLFVLLLVSALIFASMVSVFAKEFDPEITQNRDEKALYDNCAAGKGEVAHGIDVSLWQGDIDFKAVKNSGINFVMIRSSFGREDPKQVDPRFHENIKKAQAAGLHTGVYHYSYATSAADAVNEAKFCLKTIRGYKLSYPVAFDIEDDSMKKLGKRVLTDICKAFCSTIEKAGYYVVIYCNPDWLKNYLYADELLPKYDLWLAHWYVKEPSYKCGMWQYTDIGRMKGIKGNVDRDVAYKDYPRLIKSKHLNRF